MPRALSSAAIDADELDALLVRTSRTFALSIPMLPQPLRREVGIAYLLFRIADTFEDAVGWGRERRVRSLGELGELLAEPLAADDRAAGWLAGPPAIAHAGYLELLAAAPRVIAAYAALRPAARDAVRGHLGRTLSGMARFVARGDGPGGLALTDLGELRDYCYVVAGIVGEMLTDLFLVATPALSGVAGELRDRAREFGEGLQLVNVLKDSAFDRGEGRRYLPAGVPREVVMAQARRDLGRAGEYVRTLQGHGAPRGLVAFTALPVLLARQSLDRIAERGEGAKLSRAEVAATVVALEAALDRGLPAVG